MTTPETGIGALSKNTHIDIVIPVYNEEDGITAFHDLLQGALSPLPPTFTIIYVNDGSSDATQTKLAEIASRYQNVVVIELSRNFGHQAALTAGLDQAEGDYVITMDGDGQHPPALLAEMIALAENGYDIVLTQRIEDYQSTGFKRFTSQLFYRLINRISDTNMTAGAADFRLMARPAVLALRNMRESHRFLRGMVGWMGFRSVILPYAQPERIAGSSKYSLSKMLRLSTDAIFSFSLVPLYVIISMGALFLLLAAAEVVYVLSQWLLNPQSLAPGWSSLMFMLLVVGGTLMISLGFIGVYVGFIFQEVKRRPIYLIRRILNPGEENESS